MTLERRIERLYAEFCQESQRQNEEVVDRFAQKYPGGSPERFEYLVEVAIHVLKSMLSDEDMEAWRNGEMQAEEGSVWGAHAEFDFEMLQLVAVEVLPLLEELRRKQGPQWRHARDLEVLRQQFPSKRRQKYQRRMKKSRHPFTGRMLHMLRPGASYFSEVGWLFGRRIPPTSRFLGWFADLPAAIKNLECGDLVTYAVPARRTQSRQVTGQLPNKATRARLDRVGDERPRVVKYVQAVPTPMQTAVLKFERMHEVFLPGGVGSGKSYALIFLVCEYLDVRNYNASVLRTTFRELEQAEGLLTEMLEWFQPWLQKEIRWNATKRQFHFTKYGSKIQFNFLNHRKDLKRIKGGGYQLFVFDELSEFGQASWLDYVVTRQRQKVTMEMPVPDRVRSASNPEGANFEWVWQRYYGEQGKRDVVKIHSTLDHNEHIQKAKYARRLRSLPPHLQARMRHGDFSVREPGDLFQAAWFRRTVSELPETIDHRVTFVDPAFSLRETADYSAIADLAVRERGDGQPEFYLLYLWHGRVDSPTLGREIANYMLEVGPYVDANVESVTGENSPLVHQVRQTAERLAAEQGREIGRIEVFRPGNRGSKFESYIPLANAAYDGRFQIVLSEDNRTWYDRIFRTFLNELEGIREKEQEQTTHDDLVDAVAGALHILNERWRNRVGIWWPGKPKRSMPPPAEPEEPEYVEGEEEIDGIPIRLLNKRE